MRSKTIWASAAALAIGIVIGFVIGGVAPRRELVLREAEVAQLTEQLGRADQGGGWRSPVPGLDRILRGPEEENGVPLPPAGSESETTNADLDGGVAPIAWRERWRERRSDPEERLDAFRRAASIQRVRLVQSRAALAQQANLNEAELAQVDSVLSDLNTELRGHGEELVLLTMSDEPPSARELLGITHDVTGILHRAQLQLETIVGDERRQQVEPSALEIWNHVDLSQLEPAARAAVQQVR